MRALYFQTLVRNAGLDGWSPAVRPDPRGFGHVAVLTSPDFDPVKGCGRMVTARADWATRAVLDAIALANGPVLQ